MPISFSNTFYDDILGTLSSLIHNEFSINVLYDEHKGNQSFLLSPQSDELIEDLSTGLHREYTIQISYELKAGGQYTKNSLKQVSSVLERLKRLIYNNKSYSSGSVWFDANLQSINYERDEEDLTILRGVAIFNCQNIEVI